MGMLMISCPSTGRAVSTGIEMSSIEQLPTVNATIECPACGRVHEWTKDSARLVDDGEQYQGGCRRTPDRGRDQAQLRRESTPIGELSRRFTPWAAARCGCRASAPSSLADIASWRPRRRPSRR